MCLDHLITFNNNFPGFKMRNKRQKEMRSFFNSRQAT